MIVARVLIAVGRGFDIASMAVWRAGHVGSDALGFVGARLGDAGFQLWEDLEALDALLKRRPGGEGFAAGWRMNKTRPLPVRIWRAWRWRGTYLRARRRRPSPT